MKSQYFLLISIFSFLSRVYAQELPVTEPDIGNINSDNVKSYEDVDMQPINEVDNIVSSKVLIEQNEKFLSHSYDNMKIENSENKEDNKNADGIVEVKKFNEIDKNILGETKLEENSEEKTEYKTEEKIIEPHKINDPLEFLNRRVYKFNKFLDRIILKPVAKVYTKIVPEFIQQGVVNFFNYVKSPLNILNYALQGNKEELSNSMSRFVLNTFGLGVFDLAKKAKIPLHNTDFGDTLAIWGVREGPYIVLPLLGSSTLLDAATFGTVDTPLSLINTLPIIEKNRLYLLKTVQFRSDYLGMTNVLEEASLDEYMFVRDAWTQRHQSKIEEIKESKKEGK
jgi:phospholipid-binding lipoprotein MlaA